MKLSAAFAYMQTGYNEFPTSVDDAERFAWLLEQDASTQDAVLRPPIPEDLLESPEKWGEVIRAAIDATAPRR